MMHLFLEENRDELIARCRARVAQRSPGRAVAPELVHGTSIFLDQLIRTLTAEADGADGLRISGSATGIPQQSEMTASAAKHGRELLHASFTIDQVVHDYGDLCQAIGQLAVESGRDFHAGEFQTLNRCLDNAIAHAVSEFAHQQDVVTSEREAVAAGERLGQFVHEMRNALAAATLAVTVIRKGALGVGGATGALLDRSLVRLRDLIDRSIGEVRERSGLGPQEHLFALDKFVAECGYLGALEAQVKGCSLSVASVDPDLALDCDRDALAGAVGNLLQNAFKFTQPGTDVSLNAFAISDRILIEVVDHCGGLSAPADKIFATFSQADADRSGLGLGLGIARSAVTTCGGTLTVRDRPGIGCTFTIDLTRHALTPA